MKRHDHDYAHCEGKHPLNKGPKEGAHERKYSRISVCFPDVPENL